MKIGYYCADINLKRTKSLGIYKTTLEILKQLEKKKELNIKIILTKENEKYFKGFKSEKKIIKSDKPYFLKKLFIYPNLANKIAEKENMDLLFFPKGHIPFIKKKGVKYVSMIHDLIPMYYLKRGYFKYLIVFLLLFFSLRHSDLIFVNSSYTQKEIKKYAKSQVKDIPLGCNPVIPKSPNLKKESYIFVIGNKNLHKNLEKSIELIKKYNKKYKTNYKIYFSKGGLTEQELAGYYKNAKFSLFLSNIEGFGLPLIESYYYETPVVFNNKTALAEVGKALPGKCCVDDEESVFRAINEILKLKKSDILKLRKPLLKKYNWNDCGNKIIKELISVNI